MSYKYSSQYNKENMAKAVGRALPISLKHSVEICRLLRYKTTNKAKELLQKAIDKKQAIPFKIFHKDLGHKKKMGPGRYPVKAAEEILNMVKAAETNAQFKGLNTTGLYIKHINANGASRPWRFGRQRRRKAKRTNIEIIVEERIAKSEKTTGKIKDKKEIQKETKKSSDSKEEVKKGRPINKNEKKIITNNKKETKNSEKIETKAQEKNQGLKENKKVEKDKK